MGHVADHNPFHSHVNHSSDDENDIQDDSRMPCLVIEGETLSECIGQPEEDKDKDNTNVQRREKVLQIAKSVKSVICCRATPLQKVIYIYIDINIYHAILSLNQIHLIILNNFFCLFVCLFYNYRVALFR